MIELTKKEQEALLLIYKDFNNFYNANSISKKLEITQVGAMKLLKRLEKNNLLLNKKIGKSIIYKINLDQELVRKLMGFILMNEARNYERWVDEFKSLYKKERIVLFYGSASRNYSSAKDIDLMIVQDRGDFKEVYNKIQEIQKTLPKRIHEIQATKEDLVKNINNHNEAMLEITRTAIVLYGYDDYMEIINDFAKF